MSFAERIPARWDESFLTERWADRKGRRLAVTSPRPIHLATRLMRALYAAKTPLRFDDIGGQHGVNTISALRKKHGPNIIGSRKGTGYWLTEKGRRVVETSYLAPCGSPEVSSTGQPFPCGRNGGQTQSPLFLSTVDSTIST